MAFVLAGQLAGRAAAGGARREVAQPDAFDADVVVRRVELAGGDARVLGVVLGGGELADLSGPDIQGDVAFRNVGAEDGVEDQGAVTLEVVV